MRLFLRLTLLPPLAAACVPAPRAASVDPVAVNQVASAAARQVRPCYRAPRVPSAGKRIVTRLRIHLAADGTLAEPPRVVFQQGVTEENRAWAATMAEAASLAVFRCAPLRLPAELHRGGWDELDLTFSPGLLV
jgi:hypothetical protein